MPIRKSRLSRSELATYRVAAQELLRAGRIHKIPDEWLEDADFLHIFVAGAPISQVFDLPKARTGFAIWVRLVAERSPITILECDLTAPWDGESFWRTIEAARRFIESGIDSTSKRRS